MPSSQLEQTSRDPRSATHLRGSIYPDSPWPVLVRAGSAQDLHGGVLQHRGAVRNIRRGHHARKHVPALGGQSAVLQ